MNVNVQKFLFVAFFIFYLSEETSAAAIGGPFKCGNLECPNGSFCEIKRKPNDGDTSVTITAQCRDPAGTVLAEETTPEDVADGKIPFTSVTRKTVKADDSGTYFGGSYASKTIAHANLGGDGTTAIDFVPLDAEVAAEAVPEFDFDFDKIWSVFDKQKEILKETSGLFDEIFGAWDF